MKRATFDRPTDPARATTVVARMKAIVQAEYGSAPENVLRLADVARPTIGDEILVRVCAASVDRGTWRVMAGLPDPIGVAGFGLRRPKALNPGRSVVGTVESVGTDVAKLTPGNEVYGTCDGSFTEYAAAQKGPLTPKPAAARRAPSVTSVDMPMAASRRRAAPPMRPGWRPRPRARSGRFVTASDPLCG